MVIDYVTLERFHVTTALEKLGQLVPHGGGYKLLPAYPVRYAGSLALGSGPAWECYEFSTPEGGLYLLVPSWKAPAVVTSGRPWWLPASLPEASPATPAIRRKRRRKPGSRGGSQP